MIRYQKNPRVSKSVVVVDGVSYSAKYIGKGQYSRVFRVGDRVVYYTRGDCGKEVLAQFQYNRMTHLPELIRHENITTVRGVWYVFSSPYYRNVTTKDRSAYKMMAKIVRDGNRAMSALYANGFRDHDLMDYLVDDLNGSGEFPHSIIKALQEIVNVAGNCGQGVGFDLHKKNFGVNEYGTLIFRDPIYVRE
jgi:hypothetical protein